MDIYILDGNLQKLGIIQGFKSLIWAERYREVGDCELFIPASKDALELMQIGRYLFRSDVKHVCIIKKITVTTDAEQGNFLIVEGQDPKCLLDQRIVWNTTTINGNVAVALRNMVRTAGADRATADRMFKKTNGIRLLYTNGATELTETSHEQISYKNLGEVIREKCAQYDWGYRLNYATEYDGCLSFWLYKGEDKTGSVIFSRYLDNLNSTKYTTDDTLLGNVALVAGEGEGSARAKATVGTAIGVDRHEIFVDADSTSRSITYEELTASYPSGTISSSGGKYYYSVGGQIIAEVPSASPAASDTVTLTSSIYEGYLTARGNDALAEYGETTSFEGSVVPNSQFVYREDYTLGDIVSIRTEYGVQASARVVEVVEVWDEKGYSLEPKFEYVTVSNSRGALLTEDREAMLTESGTRLLAQSGGSADGITISELPAALGLDDADVLPVVQDGETKKVPYSILKALSEKAAAIPYGEVDSTSTATAFTATVAGISELKDGTIVMLKNGVVTSASGFTININGLGAKPCYNNLAAATRDTTIFNVNYTMLFIFSTSIVSGGGWICYRGYDANTNSIGYQLRTNSTVMNVSDTARYYKLYFTSADGTMWVPASVNSTNNATSARPVNQRPINPFGRIVYTSASTNYTAGSNLAATTIWSQYALALGYSFNRTGAALTLTVEKPVYLKCAPQADGSAIMDADTPIVQALPTAADGKIYIYLGVAYDATHIELFEHHPVYYHDGDGIRKWTGTEINTGFTATAYESTTGTSGAITVKTWNITEDGLYLVNASSYQTRTGYTSAQQAAMCSVLTVGRYDATETAQGTYLQRSPLTGGGDNAVSAVFRCVAGDTIQCRVQQQAGSSGATLAEQTFYVRSSIMKLKSV